MRMSMALCLIAMLVCVGTPILAEVYVAGQLGGVFPLDLNNVEGTGRIHGAKFGNLDLASSLLYGGKLGYFFDDRGWRWIGVEAEVFTTNPHVKQQQIPVAAGGGTTAILSSGAHVRTLTSAINVIARYRGGRIQPYAGVGLAFVNAKVSNATFSSSDSSPGLNVLAGLRGFLTQNLALFVEFKYTYTSFQFEDAGAVGSGIKGVYSVPGFAGGVSWHFK